MEGPPFFIVGSARSGTTLLRLLFNAHPEVAVPPESRFIVEMRPRTADIDVSDFLTRLAAHKQFSTWELATDAVRNELGIKARVPYADAVAAVYRTYARDKGKTRWGDKTPRYVRHIDFLSSLWPDARFIHIIRDGRDVALSYGDVPFGPKTVGSAARLWKERVSAGRRAGRARGEDLYMEVFYEDLTIDLENSAMRLCDFLRLGFEPEMLDYTEKARSDVLPRAGRYNPHITEKPIARVRSWERDMPEEQVEVFEAVAGDLLAELGYPVRHPVPGPRARLLSTLSFMGVPVGRLKGSGRT